MLIPPAVLAATLPYGRMALGAFVAAGAWCAGQYVTARAIRRMDPTAFGDTKTAAPPTQAERIRQLQHALLATAAGDAGSMDAAMRDPDTRAAIGAMDRMSARTPPAPANDQTAAQAA